MEGVLCKGLKWRQDLQEELEKLKALEELDSPKRWGDRPPRPVAIVRTATTIAGLKALMLRCSASPDSAMLDSGSRKRTGANWRPALRRLSAG